MRFWIALLFGFCFVTRMADAAEWHYAPAAANLRPGVLTTVDRGAFAVVSIRQFCFAFGCRVLYQWANHRAVVRNPATISSAVLSSLTHIALVDGKIVEFDGNIVSDLKEGYLLPVDLAAKMAPLLGLGTITSVGAHLAPPISRKTTLPVPNVLRKIVIDPGHGGNDLGTGFAGIYEKDVAFFYAIGLRDALKVALPDVEILLTRDGDNYITLPDRARMANSAGAGFFLSLHVNHAPDTRVGGVETYILSPDATDDEARRLALLENEPWMKTAKIRVQDSGDTIKRILIDMEQTKYIQNSALAASLIQQDLAILDRSFGLRNRGVKQAMFYVLSQVAMPSALVEIGFLSNTGDRSRLMDIAFREQVVKGIVSAIRKYRDKTGGSHI